MTLLHNLKIGSRLGLAFALILCLMVAVAGVGLASLAGADRTLTNIMENDTKKVILVNSMSEEAHIVARVIRTVVLLNDVEAKGAEARKIQSVRTAYDGYRAELQKLSTSDTDAELLAKIDAAAKEASSVNSQVLELAANLEDEAAMVMLLSQSAPKMAVWQGFLDDYIEL